MGWQDAPVVGQSPDQPAWASAPVVGGAPEAGAGRGNVNPPTVDKMRDVGAAEYIGRKALQGLGTTAKGAGILAAGPIEAALAASGSEHAGKLFSAAEDFGKWGNEAGEDQPGDTQQGVATRVAGAAVEGAPVLGAAVAAGPAGAAVLGGASGVGNTFATSLQQNLNEAATITKTVIAGVGGVLSGYLPGALGKTLPVQMATGAAIGPAVGEVQRQAENTVNQVAGRPELDQPFDPIAAAGQAVVGAALPAAHRAVPAVKEGAARAAAAVLPDVNPVTARTAQTAIDMGVPLRPDQLVTNKYAKKAGQFAEEVPLGGGQRDERISAMNTKIAKLVDPDATTDKPADPQFFDAAMNKSGGTIGDIAGKTEIPFDNAFNDALDAYKQSIKNDTPDNKAVAHGFVDDILAAVDKDGVMPGEAWRNINSELGRRIRNVGENQDLGDALSKLQDTMHDALKRNLSPEDAKAFDAARQQYAIAKQIAPLVAKSADGYIQPESLYGRVARTSEQQERVARGRAGELGKLAKVGQLVKEPPSSGTTERKILWDLARGAATGSVVPMVAARVYNKVGPAVAKAMVARSLKKNAAPPDRIDPTGPAGPQGPIEPDTSPGAGGPRDGGGGPPAGPLGDLTPDWTTTPGAGGPRTPPGGEPPPGTPAVETPRPLVPKRPSTNKAGKEVPAVPGKPGVPETIVAGREHELAPDEATGRAMQTDDAALARRQQAEKAATEAQTPAVKQAIGEHAAALKAEETVRERARVNAEDAAALEKAARETDDPRLQARLLKRANDLRAEEKIPVGNATEVPMGHGVDNSKPKGKIPTGKATEITPEKITPENPEIPVGEATEITPEYIEADRQWRAEHKLGEQDAQRARTVAQAHAIDPERVEALAQQYDKSPTRFDREIQNVIEEKRNADEAQRAAGGSQGDAQGTAGAAAPVQANERGQGVRDTRAQGDEPVPAAKSGAAGERKPEPDAAVHAADEQPGAERVPATGAQRDEAATAGRQDTARPQGKPLVARNGLEIRERPDGTGFDAYRDGKKVGHLNDNLKRGQAEQLGESANVDMVKVDPGERGKGTGKALYDAFNEKHGGRIMPSGKTEPAAWKLWKRNYPEKVDAFVKQEAQRIKDGADRDMVLGNIKDPEVAQRVADAAGKPPPDPFETDLAKEGDERDVTETPAFKRWAGGAKVVDMAESRTRDFVGEEPVVVKLVHGTVRDFDAFDRARGNPESDLGAGFYFTNTPSDVAHNYATAKGADLRVKIERMGEGYASHVMFSDDADPKLVQRFVDETGLTPEQMKRGGGDHAENYGKVRDAAEKFAQEDLTQHGGVTVPVYVRFKRPLVIGGPKESFLDYEAPYDEASDQYGEPKGQLATFLDAFRSELDSGKYELEPREVDRVMDTLLGHLIDRGALDGGGIKASELERALHESGSIDDLMDHEGTFAGREAMRQAFENAGYDGIIDQGVNMKFGPYRRFGRPMAGVAATTKHFVAFEPTQVKSSLGNRGTFDPNDPNILHAEGDVWRSPLKDFIDGSKMAKGTPEQWRGFLKNAKGVKADEIKWSGLDEYLKLREPEGPKADPNQPDLFGLSQAKAALITKAEIQDFLDKGGVQLHEKQLGGPPIKGTEPEILPELRDWFEKNNADLPTDEISWGRASEGFNARYAENQQRAKTLRDYNDADESPEEQGALNTLLAAWDTRANQFRHLRDLAGAVRQHYAQQPKPLPTKYETYRVPGGTNYRELLLQLGGRDPVLPEIVPHPEDKDSYALKRANGEYVTSYGRKPALFDSLPAAKHGQEYHAAPNPEGFDESHWQDKVKNNLMHVRVTDRTDAQGRKGLFIEELQSDWAQKARKHGIDEPVPASESKAAAAAPYEPVDELPDGWKYRINHGGGELELFDPAGVEAAHEPHALGKDSDLYGGWSPDPAAVKAHAVQLYNDIHKPLGARAEMAARRLVQESRDGGMSPKPNAPFIGKTEAWAGLGIKRVLKMAADEGYDFVAFANGAQNADHYNLRKRVNRISYDPAEGELVAHDIHNSEALREKVEPTVSALEEYIGKEPAEKLVEQIKAHAEGRGEAPEPIYDPDEHGRWTVEKEDDWESDNHYLRDHNGDTVTDRHDDPYQFDSRSEARHALRNFDVVNDGEGAGDDGEDEEHRWAIEDHRGERVTDARGDQLQFDSEEDARAALHEFEVYQDEPEARWVVRDEDGDPRETYDNEEDAQARADREQARHEKNINGDIDRNIPTISGLDLEVGGEGMQKFYDQIVPNVANNVLKQLGGGKVRPMELQHDAGLNKPKPFNEDVVRRLLAQGREVFLVDINGHEHSIGSDQALTDWLTSEDKPYIRSYVEGENKLTQPGFDITPAMKETVKGGVPMFREGEQQAGASVPNAAPKPLGTPEALDQTLRGKFGDKLIDGLQRAGVLKYVAQSEEQPEGSRTLAVMHQKALQPHASLYYDRLTAEQAPGVLMHELGEHYGIVRLLGNERYRLMLDDLQKLKDSGDPEVAEAWDHVKERYVDRQGTAFRVNEGDVVFMREVAARLVERAPDQHFVRRIINEIRAFFFQHFGTTMGNRVDANLIRGLAAAALRKAATGDLPIAIPGRAGNPASFRPFVPQSEGGQRPPMRRLFQSQQPQP